MNSEPTPKPGKKSKVKVIAALFAGVIAASSGVIGSINYFQTHNRFDAFSGEITSPETASKFANFPKGHDQKIVKLENECGETDKELNITAGQVAPDSHCFFMPGQTEQQEHGVLATGQYTAYQYRQSSTAGTNIDANTTWFEVNIPDSDSDSNMSNGPKGAGWLIVKGYFSNSRTSIGTALRTSINTFYIRSTSATRIHDLLPVTLPLLSSLR